MGSGITKGFTCLLWYLWGDWFNKRKIGGISRFWSVWFPGIDSKCKIGVEKKYALCIIKPKTTEQSGCDSGIS